MNKLLPLLTFSVLLLAPVGAQQAFAETLYTVDTNTDRLESIDTDTLAFTDIGPLGVPVVFEGLAYDPNTDTLYLIDGRGNEELYEVNRNTGQATLIGPHGITDLFGLAFDSKNNVLYATVFSTGELYSLNVNNGQAAFIANTGISGDGLAYDSLNDRLVGLVGGSGDVYEINRVNGQATLLFNGAFVNNNGLAYDPDKDLFWAIDFDGNLFTFDPNNGFLRTTEVNGLTPHTALAYLVTPTQTAVGGELLPIETTSLLLAGAQTFSWMIPVVLSVLGIGLVLVKRK